ncbi:MAG: hypothetical protein ACD_75C01285G0001, partial [uncultured bacterium]
MRNEHTCLCQTLQFGLGNAEFAEHRIVVLTLESRCSDRRQLIAREMPRPARQTIFATVTIRHMLNCTPVFAPLRFDKILGRADLAHRDLGFIELGIERRHVGERQHPRLDDLMQRTEIQTAARGRREPRIVHQID